MSHLNRTIAVIGAGASGSICTYLLLKLGYEVTLFDKSAPLRTLLPTGGGRCNLAHAEYDFRELAKNYPRGEKFLYSIFSKFSTYGTISLFEELGIKTYTQEDGRIFPVSNSAKDVREKILNKIQKANFVRENVIKLEKLGSDFKITTQKEASQKQCKYLFSDIIVAVGGHSKLDFLKELDINIIQQKPSLVGLNTNLKELSGVVLKNVYSNNLNLEGDVLFTHFGVSGPLIYKISAIKAFDQFPYKLSFNCFTKISNFQDLLNSNPHKEVKNILSNYLPLSFVKYVLKEDSNTKAHLIDGKKRDEIIDKFTNFELTILSPNRGEETVSAGGIDLKEVSSKLESKKHKSLYFTGECLNIDGFCGGFNLQNAWSTAYIAVNENFR